MRINVDLTAQGWLLGIAGILRGRLGVIFMATEFLIIGGEGDLALRKLYPAFYSLDAALLLPSDFRITGLAPAELSSEQLEQSIHEQLQNSGDYIPEVWERFRKRIRYIVGDATSENAMRSYKSSLADPNSLSLLVYLAIPSKIYGAVAAALNAAELVHPQTLLAVEKPLGASQDSFLEINRQLSEHFTEQQIYRVDHYLGKETVQNLLALRFANIILGSLWSSEYIDHVQITVAETVGLEKRREFYDETGALRDMVQNHLLQVLCLVAMEPPANSGATMIRSEKLKVLRCLKPITLADIDRFTVRGQYAGGSLQNELVQGYQQEIGPERTPSQTETFVSIKAEIDNWRWAGVPFFLRTGKRMTTRYSEILIQFRSPKHSIFPEQIRPFAANQLLIRLQPDEGITLKFLNKVAGFGGDIPLQEVALDLSVSDAQKSHAFDAYARLLMDMLRSDQTLFVSKEEVDASWVWIDQIIDHWQQAGSKAYPYPAGSMGPSEAFVMMDREGRRWNDYPEDA